MISKKPKAKKAATGKNPLPARRDGSVAPTKRLGTPREACEYGRFSHTKLYDYINEGRVDAYKRDKHTLIDLNSIDRMHDAMPKIEPKPKEKPQQPAK